MITKFKIFENNDNVDFFISESYKDFTKILEEYKREYPELKNIKIKLSDRDSRMRLIWVFNNYYNYTIYNMYRDSRNFIFENNIVSVINKTFLVFEEINYQFKKELKNIISFDLNYYNDDILELIFKNKFDFKILDTNKFLDALDKYLEKTASKEIYNNLYFIYNKILDKTQNEITIIYNNLMNKFKYIKDGEKFDLI